MLTKYIGVVIPSRHGCDRDQFNAKDFGDENAASVL